MEPRESVPSLNLESIASDRRVSGSEAAKHESNRSEDSKNEMETQTCGAGGGGERSEIGNSKSSLELVDAVKDGEGVSSSSSSFAPVFRDPKRDRRLKRHPPDRTDNIGSNAFETNESSPLPDSIRSSARGTLPPPDPDDHLPISRDRSRRKTDEERDLECSLDSAVEDAIVAENKRLKEVLSRERRHHLKEKNRIRQVLIAIDEALSTLPTRLGKIRVQNQKNLMKMNALPVEFHDRGDFEMIVGNCPKYLRNVEEGNETSIHLSEDVYSDMSNPRNTNVFEKIESVNNLIEGMKKGRGAPIEAVLDNELCAISLLKNEIKYTRRKIEQKSREDSESAVVANWQFGNGQSPHPRNWNPKRAVDPEEIEKLEKYIWLQKEAISVLSMQVEKTRELCVKEMKQKEQVQSEKRVLMSEIVKLRNREESQGSRTRSSDSTSMPRPFRLIKELKGQLEEKDKILSNFRAKISRLEAATANKGTLLDNERRKVEELEGRLKILASENKSFSIQINSLQYINKELKEQMDVLKSQIEILIEKNAEVSANNPYDLQKNFAEIMDMLKREDARARVVQEEAERKLREQQNQHLKEIDGLRASFERSEKMNLEYLRTVKGVISYLHNYQSEKNMRRKRRNSYGKVKEILGITEGELESLFGGNLKNTAEKELQDLYDKCHSFINGSDDHEFSFKLSAWLFDLIKQKMSHQNFNESLSD